MHVALTYHSLNFLNHFNLSNEWFLREEMILELDKSASCFSDLDLDRERFHNYNLFTRKLFPDLDFNWKRFDNYILFTSSKRNVRRWLGTTTNNKKVNFTADLIPASSDSPIDRVRCDSPFLSCLETGVHHEITNIEPFRNKIHTLQELECNLSSLDFFHIGANPVK